MKSFFIALILSFVLTITSYIGPQIVHGIIQSATEPKNVDQIVIGDTPPPSWARGLPFKIMGEYEDCPAGCIGSFSGGGLILNIVFYFVVSYLGLRYLRKVKK